MREKAIQIFEELKQKDKQLSDSFDEYVKLLSENLDIEKDIAVKLVRDELINRYDKKLIMSALFSKMTLDDNKSNWIQTPGTVVIVDTLHRIYFFGMEKPSLVRAPFTFTGG